MKKVSSADFQKNTGRWQDIALTQPITITKHDRPTYVLLSFEAFKKLTGSTRRALHVSELSDEDLEELATSKVSKKHDHLNSELEE